MGFSLTVLIFDDTGLVTVVVLAADVVVLFSVKIVVILYEQETDSVVILTKLLSETDDDSSWLSFSLQPESKADAVNSKINNIPDFFIILPPVESLYILIICL